MSNCEVNDVIGYWNLILVLIAFECYGGPKIESWRGPLQNLTTFKALNATNINQMCVQSWEKFRLDEYREIECTKFVSCLIFGCTNANVSYFYSVIDRKSGPKPSSIILLEAQEACTISSRRLLDIVMNSATTNASNGMGMYILGEIGLRHENELDSSQKCNISDPFSAEASNLFLHFSLRIGVESLWQGIKNEGRRDDKGSFVRQGAE